MGHAADDARYEQMLGELMIKQHDVHVLRLRRLRSIAPGWWITKSGEPIEIRALAKEHLDNIIAMVKRNDLHRTRKYKELVAEKARREERKK